MRSDCPALTHVTRNTGGEELFIREQTVPPGAYVSLPVVLAKFECHLLPVSSFNYYWYRWMKISFLKGTRIMHMHRDIPPLVIHTVNLPFIVDRGPEAFSTQLAACRLACFVLCCGKTRCPKHNVPADGCSFVITDPQAPNH